MKLCPQCAFLYEDVQTFCDMDGSKLVPDAPTVVVPPPTAVNEPSSPSRLTIDLRPAPSHKRSASLAIVAGLVLAGLLAGGYFAQRKWRSQPAKLVQAPTSVITPQASPAISSTANQDTQATAESSTAVESANNSVPAESVKARSALSPSSRLRAISSGSVTGNNQKPVLLRLTNGATIKADEVWERKDGIWYRQGGLITFLKRSQVRSIERPTAIVPARSESTVGQRNQVASAQTRPAKTEVVTVKKDSKVTSFIKRTGRFLKKPFKF